MDPTLWWNGLSERINPRASLYASLEVAAMSLIEILTVNIGSYVSGGGSKGKLFYRFFGPRP